MKVVRKASSQTRMGVGCCKRGTPRLRQSYLSALHCGVHDKQYALMHSHTPKERQSGGQQEVAQRQPASGACARRPSCRPPLVLVTPLLFAVPRLQGGAQRSGDDVIVSLRALILRV